MEKLLLITSGGEPSRVKSYGARHDFVLQWLSHSSEHVVFTTRPSNSISLLERRSDLILLRLSKYNKEPGH